MPNQLVTFETPVVEDEDSPDLTDAEVEQAVIATSLHQVSRHLSDMTCSSCSAPLIKRHYALRRRKPSMYWRVILDCAEGHANVVVFRTDFGNNPVGPLVSL